MTLNLLNSTPLQDDFYMPAEYSPIEQVWVVWPYRLDNWRDNAKPAQKAYLDVAIAISEFCNVIIIADPDQTEYCLQQVNERLNRKPPIIKNATTNQISESIVETQETPFGIKVVSMSNDDAWVRDTGPSFLINKTEKPSVLRACDWTFNAWGGDFDGLYSPWQNDDKLASLICDYLDIKRYRTDDFVLEGGAFHVDGEGTVLTTRMCLLSEGRNPSLTEKDIEYKLKQYLNVEKVLWLDDGIDPEETTGHVDDVACFVRPGEVVCLYTEDPEHPFYETAQKCYQQLSTMTDARGRKLMVHKLCCTIEPVTLPEDIVVTDSNNKQAKVRKKGQLCIASYVNFLICNSGVIVPQYGDQNDELALKQLSAIFPNHKVVGVPTREIVYGGGNIHCITQQQPAV